MAEKNYKELKDELEQIIAKLESDEVDLDESIELYEKGQKLVASLEKYIQKADLKIKKIK